MATEKEQIIFEYKLDMGDALGDAERFKRNIIQTKEEQKQLNDAYKKGSISLDEYAKETVRLEAILKKEQTTYNDLSKAMTGTKTQTDKLIESNNKLAKSNTDLGGKIQSVAGNINIAGTNLGSLTTQVGAFLNPATAAATIVGTLATAYFNTGRGAQDLEAIQFKLQATTEVLSNKVADLVDKFKDPESSIGKFGRALIDTNPIIQGLKFQFNLLLGDTKEEINALADIKAKLDDLDEGRAVAQAKFNNLLEDNASLLADINEAETKYTEKQDKLQLMRDNINNAFKQTLDIKYEEVALLNKVLDINKDDEATRRRVNSILLEISQEERKREKLLANVKKATDNIEETERKRLEAVSKIEEKERLILEHKNAQIDTQTQDVVDSGLAISESLAANEEEVSLSLANMTLKTDALSAAIAKKNKTTEDGIKASNAALKADRDRTGSLLILSNAIGGAATIFEKHTIASKFLSAAQAGINSFLAGTEVLKDPSFVGRPVQRIVAMVATVAAGLAQQGKILGAFAGGGSFMTKGPTWLLVGDNPGGRERVDVTPVSGKGQTRIFNDGVAMAGGGSINGSILAASSTAPIDSQFGIQDALSEIPFNIQFVETDYQRFRQKITFKEQISER